MIENKEFILTLPNAADGTTNIDTKRSIVMKKNRDSDHYY